MSLSGLEKFKPRIGGGDMPRLGDIMLQNAKNSLMKGVGVAVILFVILSLVLSGCHTENRPCRDKETGRYTQCK